MIRWWWDDHVERMARLQKSECLGWVSLSVLQSSPQGAQSALLKERLEMDLQAWMGQAYHAQVAIEYPNAVVSA